MSAAKKTNVIHFRKPRTFTASERVIEYLSVRIMQSGKSYRQIAEDCGVSQTTIAKIATRQTTWPRPHTFFAVLNYFNIELRLD